MIPRLFLVFLLACFLVGCANQERISLRERIVVLPGPGGKVGTVVVQNRSGEATLNSAYAAVEVGGPQFQAKTLTEADIQQRYKTTLEALPKRPQSFTLFFVFDKIQLLPESKPAIASIINEFSLRDAPEILVIGHADKVGESQYNDDLSRKRAEATRDLLIKEGIPKENIEIQWRGDREPIYRTGLMDQRNRRVEVKIR